MIRVIVHSDHRLDVNFFMLPFQHHKSIPGFEEKYRLFKIGSVLFSRREKMIQSFNKKESPDGESGNISSEFCTMRAVNIGHVSIKIIKICKIGLRLLLYLTSS